MINNPLSKVILHGALATAVGKAEWEFHVATPAEAIQAIDIMSDGKLLDFLSEDLLAVYRVVIDGKDVDLNELFLNLPAREMHILPVLQGEGGNSGGMMMGIGLALIIVAAFVFPAIGIALGPMLTQTIVMVGITMALAGIAQMLAPDQKENEKQENTASYLFNGAVNTYRQGNPIPVGFGKLRVGSQVVSVGIRNLDVKAADQRFEMEFIEMIGSGEDLSQDAMRYQVIPGSWYTKRWVYKDNHWYCQNEDGSWTEFPWYAHHL